MCSVTGRTLVKGTCYYVSGITGPQRVQINPFVGTCPTGYEEHFIYQTKAYLDVINILKAKNNVQTVQLNVVMNVTKNMKQKEYINNNKKEHSDVNPI